MNIINAIPCLQAELDKIFRVQNPLVSGGCFQDEYFSSGIQTIAQQH